MATSRISMGKQKYGVTMWRQWIEGTQMAVPARDSSPVKVVIFASDAGHSIYTISWIGRKLACLVGVYGGYTHDELTFSDNVDIMATLNPYECAIVIDV